MFLDSLVFHFTKSHKTKLDLLLLINMGNIGSLGGGLHSLSAYF